MFRTYYKCAGGSNLNTDNCPSKNATLKHSRLHLLHLLGSQKSLSMLGSFVNNLLENITISVNKIPFYFYSFFCTPVCIKVVCRRACVFPLGLGVHAKKTNMAKLCNILLGTSLPANPEKWLVVMVAGRDRGKVRFIFIANRTMYI